MRVQVQILPVMANRGQRPVLPDPLPPPPAPVVPAPATPNLKVFYDSFLVHLWLVSSSCFGDLIFSPTCPFATASC